MGTGAPADDESRADGCNLVSSVGGSYKVNLREREKLLMRRRMEERNALLMRRVLLLVPLDGSSDCSISPRLIDLFISLFLRETLSSFFSCRTKTNLVSLSWS